MMKRSGTRSPWEVDEFGSSSGKGVGKSEAVVEVDSVSNSILPMVEVDCVSSSVSPALAEAAEAPSPMHVATSDVEPVVSPSRSEVETIVVRNKSPTSHTSSGDVAMVITGIVDRR